MVFVNILFDIRISRQLSAILSFDIYIYNVYNVSNIILSIYLSIYLSMHMFCLHHHTTNLFTQHFCDLIYIIIDHEDDQHI